MFWSVKQLHTNDSEVLPPKCSRFECFSCQLLSYALVPRRPSVLDNFALISGQLNTINKLLKNEKTPSFRNQVIIPLLLSPDRDEDLAVSIKAPAWCVRLCVLFFFASLSGPLTSSTCSPTETHRAACPSVQPWDSTRLPADQAWSRGGRTGETAEYRSSANWPRGGTGLLIDNAVLLVCKNIEGTVQPPRNQYFNPYLWCWLFIYLDCLFVWC